MIATLLSSPIVFGTSISEVLQDLGLGALVWGAFKHFNCHVNRPSFCWRWGHPVPGTSYRACHHHHGERDSSGEVTADHIKIAATKARRKKPNDKP